MGKTVWIRMGIVAGMHVRFLVPETKFDSGIWKTGINGGEECGIFRQWKSDYQVVLALGRLEKV